MHGCHIGQHTNFYVSILLPLLLVVLQAVADAELDGDEDMLAITASHAAKYAVHLIREAASMVCMPSKVCAGRQRPSSPLLSALIWQSPAVCRVLSTQPETSAWRPLLSHRPGRSATRLVNVVWHGRQCEAVPRLC